MALSSAGSLNRRKQIVAWILVGILFAATGIAVIVILLQPPPRSHNARSFEGTLSVDSPRASFAGTLGGPANFTVAAQAVKCSLVIGQSQAYKSECKSFEYVFVFEETVEFSLDIEIATDVSFSTFNATVRASEGIRGIRPDGPIQTDSTFVADIPAPGQRVSRICLPRDEDHDNRTLSRTNPSNKFLVRIPECAQLTFDASVSLTFSVTVGTIVIVRGDECRGVTQVDIFREVSTDLEFELQITLSNPDQLQNSLSLEVWASGPGISFQ